MHINTTFKNMETSQALKDYVSKRLSKMEKYLDRPTEANVVLSVEKIRHKTEVTLNADGMLINAVEITEDMYSSIDMVMDKVERQIKKHKEKLQDKKSHQRNVQPTAAELEAIADSNAPQIIKEEDYFVKPMSVEEAALQMDVTDYSFLIFQNTDSNRVNILYKRDDGHLGLVEPEA